jgi:hypothetical protein
MYCRTCGKEQVDTAEICVSCGSKPKAGSKYCQSCGSDTNPNAELCVKCGSRLAHEGVPGGKDWLTTLLLSWFLGYVGVDRFYLGYTGLGILKLLTGGGLGIWWLIDFIKIASNKMKDSQGRPLNKK